MAGFSTRTDFLKPCTNSDIPVPDQWVVLSSCSVQWSKKNPSLPSPTHSQDSHGANLAGGFFKIFIIINIGVGLIDPMAHHIKDYISI